MPTLPTVDSSQVESRLIDFQLRLEKYDRARKKQKLDPHLARDLQPGWLLPYLWELDAQTWQRWQYWAQLVEAGELIAAPIPEIYWCGCQSRGISQAQKHLETCLDLIAGDSWQGWSNWTYFNYFLDWLLYGFGHPGYETLPHESHTAVPAPVRYGYALRSKGSSCNLAPQFNQKRCKGASMRLYQVFNLAWLLAYPYDYWGDILAENRFGQRSGFYPTPMNLAMVMARLVLAGEVDQDQRLATVCDPCVGTGRLLLVASNYSLRLAGQDINGTVIKATLVNGYCYAPWLVKPIPWLDAESYCPEAITADGRTVEQVQSESMTAQATGEAAAYLQGSVFESAQQRQFRPLKKRTSKTDPEYVQMSLLE